MRICIKSDTNLSKSAFLALYLQSFERNNIIMCGEYWGLFGVGGLEFGVWGWVSIPTQELNSEPDAEECDATKVKSGNNSREQKHSLRKTELKTR